LLHPGVNWKQEYVQSFDPENNRLSTDKSDVTYDYLVVATGLELRYDLIPGSMDALQDTSCPAGSMYDINFAYKMRALREKFTGGKAVFTLP